jgi:hypothetical protein
MPKLRIMMPILLDRTLREYADQAFVAARLRRNSVHATGDLVFAEMLAAFETSGDAMRYVTYRGEIAWKATPKLRQYLKDLELDAQGDLEDI